MRVPGSILRRLLKDACLSPAIPRPVATTALNQATSGNARNEASSIANQDIIKSDHSSRQRATDSSSSPFRNSEGSPSCRYAAAACLYWLRRSQGTVNSAPLDRHSKLTCGCTTATRDCESCLVQELQTILDTIEGLGMGLKGKLPRRSRAAITSSDLTLSYSLTRDKPVLFDIPFTVAHLCSQVTGSLSFFQTPL